MSTTLTPRFVTSQRGRIFVVLRAPRSISGPAVLVVPPFAEEMNKSRRMLADVASALAERGIATLMPDLYGTGDSEGDFRDADIEVWQRDLGAAAEWGRSLGWRVRAVLAVRLGCSLAARLVAREELDLHSTVFWQPVLDGSRFLTQFLRLRVAASMSSGEGKESVEQLRAALRDAGSIEVAGYDITQRFAEQLDTLRLEAPALACLGKLHWMELVRGEGLTPPSQRVVDAARADRIDVVTHAIAGEPFWASVEILSNAALIARTVDALSELR